VQDITVSDSWEPLGYDTAFTGVFDGNGHAITLNGGIIAMGGTSEKYAGLFGIINHADAVVKNLTLDGNLSIEASADELYVGGIVGLINAGTIENCGVRSSISVINKLSEGITYAGGIAGSADNQAYNDPLAIGACSFTGPELRLTGSGDAYAGGIAGYNIALSGGAGDDTACIEYCYSTANIVSASASAEVILGGIAGHLQCTPSSYKSRIIGCYAGGTITNNSSNADSYAGGIAGTNTDALIQNCVALNPDITLAAVLTNNYGRVAGGGLLMNNFGLDEMTKNVGTGTWADNTTTGKDGGDITDLQAADEDWWSDSSTGVWKDTWGTNSSAPWTWDEGTSRPKLYWE
jgi:hypothetical protein